MKKRHVRVRFAPSPTGFMHVGNVRAAVFNYLFARQNKGSFLLRIEDTDEARNIKDGLQAILDDLAWLGIQADEEPVFQSKRTALYDKYLQILEEKGAIYRCYCTRERLDQVRAAQAAAGKPPRYDGYCRERTDMPEGMSYLWRFKRNETAQVAIETLERGQLTFDMQHFYDAPLTRSDGSYTFLFTNAVDDMDMEITHVIRGQDHLTNTALQVGLYEACGRTLPTFVHLPLLGTPEGKKLSKRDQGSSLGDVRDAGILPDPLVHYLLTVGGTTIDGVLAHEKLWAVPFTSRLTKASMITYDLDALNAINRRYVHVYASHELVAHVRAYTKARDTRFKEVDDVYLSRMVSNVQDEANDLIVLIDMCAQLAFPPAKPDHEGYIAHCKGDQARAQYLAGHIAAAFLTIEVEDGITRLKQWAKKEGEPMGLVLGAFRFMTTGHARGLSIGAIARSLSRAQIMMRIAQMQHTILVATDEPVVRV